MFKEKKDAGSKTKIEDVESVQEEEITKEEKGPEVTESQEAEPEEEAKQGEEEVKDDLNKTIDSLKDDNKLLSNEIETLKDRLLRITAEYENFRKRTAKEKEAIYKDSCVEIIKTILPVLDNLERAVDAEGDVESYKKGVEMTLQQFNESFKKLDVEEVKTDIPFDPNLHEAVMHIEDENYGEKEIIDVFQKGYEKGDKIIRHSVVKVAN